MVFYVIDETNYVASDENLLKNITTFKFNTEVWNLSIMFVSEGVQAPGIVLSVFFFIHFKWKRLWEILLEMSQILVLPRSFHQQLRRVSYCAATYLMAVKKINQFQIKLSIKMFPL